ncbi:MAG: AbrB/MazE/SpoVT family DNA-binding domain-containing protein [Thermomicrobiales bacterium]|nr:AbrB/MazE/SpoVT family DNA-binding domain-containing protein [Thermomicrobiales bacterium]MCO5219974.1 AbrB/MazE/SpoVT family DNA-binding domain-containing protein [Thermomicrobiales bacterium]
MALTHTTVVTRKGQTTIPAEIREKLGIQEGDRLLWWEENGRMQLMEASEYVRQMTERFRTQADPLRSPLTIEEMKEVAADGWTERYRRWIEEE